VISSNSSIEETGEAIPDAATPDPAPRPVRRSFTAAYRLAVVAEYEAAPRGEKGAVLRREGLYHSHIKEWARARDAGALSGLGGARGSTRSSKGSGKDRGEVERLRAQNVRLTAQLTQTRTALDIMGKAHELLEMLSESTGTTTPPRRS
jgi:transposase